MRSWGNSYAEADAEAITYVVIDAKNYDAYDASFYSDETLDGAVDPILVPAAQKLVLDYRPIRTTLTIQLDAVNASLLEWGISPSSTGQIAVNYTTGELEFHLSDVGKTVTASYKHYGTVIDAHTFNRVQKNLVDAATTATWGAITGTLADQADLNAALSGKEPSIAIGTSAQYWRGDKTWQTLDKAAVGLSNVDNTSDANKPVSTATQTALNLKANLTGAAFTGNISTTGSLQFTSNIRQFQTGSSVQFYDMNFNTTATPALDADRIIRFGRETNTGTGTLYSTWYKGDNTGTASMSLNHKTGALSVAGSIALTGTMTISSTLAVTGNTTLANLYAVKLYHTNSGGFVVRTNAAAPNPTVFRVMAGNATGGSFMEFFSTDFEADGTNWSRLKVGARNNANPFVISSDANGTTTKKPIAIFADRLSSDETGNQLYLATDGNTGIQNPSPQYELHVTGSVCADSYLSSNENAGVTATVTYYDESALANYILTFEDGLLVSRVAE